MTLLITSYFKSDNPERNAELKQCVVNNCANPLIDWVVLVTESDGVEYPENDKIMLVKRDSRPTFTELMGIASDLNPEGLNILVNADIYFIQEDIAIMKSIDLTDTVMVLTRHDDKNGEYRFLNIAGSHDAWCWHGKLILPMDFFPGTGGCDNHGNFIIAHSGRTLVNPSNIKAIHLHNTPGVSHFAKAIPPPYVFPKYCKYNPKPLKNLFFVAMGNGNFNGAFRRWTDLEHYEEMIYVDIIKQYGVDEFNIRLFDRIKAVRPDVVFSQTHDAGSVTLNTIKRVKEELGIQWLNWTGDVSAQRAYPSWYKELHPYGITLYSNTDYMAITQTEGYRSYFLNHYDTSVHHYYPGVPKNYDINFIGSCFNQFGLDGFRNGVIYFLYNVYGAQFNLFGNGWGNIPHKFVSRDEACVINNQSKIAINISQESMGRYSSDRLCHILASGCFCASHWFPGCEDLFEDGKHIRYFNDVGELKGLVDYYLSHDKEREEIGLAGRERNFEVFGDQNLYKTLKRVHQFVDN